jgi:hypothetical protein
VVFTRLDMDNKRDFWESKRKASPKIESFCGLVRGAKPQCKNGKPDRT